MPINYLAWILALWALPMLVVAPLFSRDVFSYAAQGEMVSHHINPYLYGPGTLGTAPTPNPVDPLWGNTPAPYGPLFLMIDGFFASISLHHELATVVLLRLLALAGVAAHRLVRPQAGPRRTTATRARPSRSACSTPSCSSPWSAAPTTTPSCWASWSPASPRRTEAPLVGRRAVHAGRRDQGPGRARDPLRRLGLARPGPPLRQRMRPVVTAGAPRGRGPGASSPWSVGLGWGWVAILGTPGRCAAGCPGHRLGLGLTGLAHLVGIGVSLGGVLSVTRFLGLAGGGRVGV